VQQTFEKSAPSALRIPGHRPSAKVQALLNPDGADRALPRGFPALPPSDPVTSQQRQPRRRTQRAGPSRLPIWTSFLLCVALPVALAAYYLFAVAAPQYASYVGFSVRSEEAASPFELLSGLGDLSHASSADADILFDYARSQALVEAVDQQVDLARLWRVPYDPLFSLQADASIETLHTHWGRMVRVSFDPNSHLITIRALAFDPDDAQAITQAAYDQSTRMINALSDRARHDATAYARADFEQAQSDLREARLAVTEFRARTRMVDPSADIQGRMGVVSSLQAQLAQAMIDYDALVAANRPNRDFARQEAENRIAIIRDLIADERAALTTETTATGTSYASVVAEFERLNVDLGFAQDAYVAARAALDAAEADARRTTRYLAAHIPPTRAESASFPRRFVLLGLLAGALFLLWSIGSILHAAIRDRR